MTAARGPVDAPAHATPHTVVTRNIDDAPARPPFGAELRRGFVALIPLWLGVVPFAALFAIIARAGGFTILETQALSALVFAGSAQLAGVNLMIAGAGGPAVLATTLLLNVRHALYGLSLGRHLPVRTRPPRAVLAFQLTDETYGLTIADYLEGRGSDAFCFGANLSLYLAFNLSTLAGSLLGGAVPERIADGLDFVFPLSFLALLLPLLRAPRQIAVAAVAAALAIALSGAGNGAGILIPALAAATLGALLDHAPRQAPR